MNTDDNVWTPPLEDFGAVTDATLLEKLSRLGPNAVNSPVHVLHPMLFISQQPVINVHQFRRDRMRFFNRTDHANSVRLSFKKLLHTGDNRRRGRAMAASGV